MNDPAKLHKLMVFSQLLVELHIQTLDVEHKLSKRQVRKTCAPCFFIAIP